MLQVQQHLFRTEEEEREAQEMERRRKRRQEADALGLGVVGEVAAADGEAEGAQGRNGDGSAAATDGAAGDRRGTRDGDAAQSHAAGADVGRTRAVRRGLIRYVYVAVDSSEGAAEKDMRPNRLAYVRRALLHESFVGAFFDQNPISQLALMTTRDGVAHGITELSGSAKAHMRALQEDGRLQQTSGNASLQNTVELAVAQLDQIPEYGQRELLIIFSSLSTCDPHDIFDTIEKAKQARVRVSIISLSAEIYVCRKLAEDTGGTFRVPLDERHFIQQLMEHVQPPACTRRSVAAPKPSMVYVGFPRREVSEVPCPAYDGQTIAFANAAFLCPFCQTRVVDMPTTCPICALQLNLSTHVSRSYHHLYPVPPFDTVHIRSEEQEELERLQLHEQEEGAAGLEGLEKTGSQQRMVGTGDGEHVELVPPQPCESCQVPCPHGTTVYRCRFCHLLVCSQCDVFIHEALHNCPGCLVSHARAITEQDVPVEEDPGTGEQKQEQEREEETR